MDKLIIKDLLPQAYTSQKWSDERERLNSEIDVILKKWGINDIWSIPNEEDARIVHALDNKIGRLNELETLVDSIVDNEEYLEKFNL
jgi:hypothetical protein